MSAVETCIPPGWNALFPVLNHLKNHIEGDQPQGPWISGYAKDRAELFHLLPFPVRDILLIEYLRSMLPIWEVLQPAGHRKIWRVMQNCLSYALYRSRSNRDNMVEAMEALTTDVEADVAAGIGGPTAACLIRIERAADALCQDGDQLVTDGDDAKPLSWRRSSYQQKMSITIDCALAVEQYGVIQAPSLERRELYSPYIAQWRWMEQAYSNAVPRPSLWRNHWCSSTAVALAKGIFNEVAFDRMPILADALQDADCDNDEILDHLRNPTGTFTRADSCLWHVMGLDAKLSPSRS